ncbi:hypothetical protein [Streptomyces albicerus]|uniref:hypothetical protein n=1 Tax=Streptomyces albicerus TaxID=2569859 RepID=UPI001788B958|nr:hypothetical protein [Streptomyces albicerus]
MPLAAFFASSALLAAAGLCVIAPRRTPRSHLLPAARTVALIALAVIYVVAIWSH